MHCGVQSFEGLAPGNGVLHFRLGLGGVAPADGAEQVVIEHDESSGSLNLTVHEIRKRTEQIGNGILHRALLLGARCQIHGAFGEFQCPRWIVDIARTVVDKVATNAFRCQ